MIPRLRPDISPADVASAFAASGSVGAFETAFAGLMGQHHAIAFPYGRTGLLLLIEALGLKGREIICPAYTCVVVPHAIVLSGNTPVFVDSRAGDFNMDLDAAEAAITERTAAILPTSIHGYPVDLDRLDVLKKKHPDIAVIQDCAHSFAAAWRDRPVQTAGNAAVFGLNISKLITSIFGGMITTDDDALAKRLRTVREARLKQPGAGRSLSRAVYLLAAKVALNPKVFSLVDAMLHMGVLGRFTDYYDPAEIDMPTDHLVGMCRAEATVGERQTGRYAGIIAHRRQIAALYDALLADCPNTVRPPLVPGATYSHYVLRVAEPDRLVADARRRGIELGRVIDYCIPDMLAYRSYVKTGADFPVTRALNQQVANLPLHVSEQDARSIVSTIVPLLSDESVRHRAGQAL